MWAAISRAAMDYHNHHKERGLGVLIATDAGVTPQSVSDWKRLETYPGDDTIMRLAELYGVPATELMGEAPHAQDMMPTTEALRLARELTSMVTLEVLPNGSAAQILDLMHKAHDLIQEGRSENEAYGILFRYALDKRQADQVGGKDDDSQSA